MEHEQLRWLISSLAKTRHGQTVGKIGEKLVAHYLAKSGYMTYKPDKHRAGDIHAIDKRTGEVIFVEVKTGRKCKDGKYRFTLQKQSKTSHTNHLDSDVVVLLCVTNAMQIIPYVIPVAVISCQRQAVITSHPMQYHGRLAKWRQHVTDLNLSTLALC